MNKSASFPTRLRLGFVVVSWISPCVFLIVNVVKIFIDTNWAYWVHYAAKERMDLMKDVSDRVRKLPFAVARSSRATLVEQVLQVPHIMFGQKIDLFTMQYEEFK